MIKGQPQTTNSHYESYINSLQTTRKVAMIYMAYLVIIETLLVYAVFFNPDNYDKKCIAINLDSAPAYVIVYKII